MMQVKVKKIRKAQKSHVPSIGSEGLIRQDLQNSDSWQEKLCSESQIIGAAKS